MILTNFSRQLRNAFLLLESTHTSPSVSAASTMCASYGGTGADAYINELWLHRRTCPRLRGHGHATSLLSMKDNLLEDETCVLFSPSSYWHTEWKETQIHTADPIANSKPGGFV